MAGSGTTLMTGRSYGYEAFGIDRDPLAVLIARASTIDFDEARFEREARAVLAAATALLPQIDARSDFPEHCDKETRSFLRYWFDPASRRELLALLRAVDHVEPRTVPFIKLAISRMIITKQSGVSLAQDISHSRPHRTRDLAPRHPLELFPQAISFVARNAPFRLGSGLPPCSVKTGDCRNLSRFPDGFFDHTITSPPYLNAIDYLRGHRLSLVWFGMTLAELCAIRSTNLGTERGTSDESRDWIVDQMVPRRQALSNRFRNIIRRYAHDLEATLKEIARVTRPGGMITLVVGDSTLRGTEVYNSRGVQAIAHRAGLRKTSYSVRAISATRRYLPPPTASSSRGQITKRMWNEVVIGYRKTS